ncbi:hypothetical protein [Gallionella capsiferriformans]|jgi:hypothetical protein|uniref:Uncharacterized protein n=1 Tax=Gallionella capsiferriformans (strain ES-2) TaxID=395494 RepID=D9SIQ8_GALCS|nr:hypothetical protein [Gallionella capsiferriformans]ADL56221.1 hypothetical protein Galf_2217 [Gallionella capsiferriformans ES-2]
MAISSVSINPPSSGQISSPISQIFSNQATPVTDRAKSSADTPPSTIVTLSAQAQKLSQTQTQTNENSLTYSVQKSSTDQDNDSDNSSTGNVKAVPKEANEAIGIQFIAGEFKGGRISTYA